MQTSAPTFRADQTTLMIKPVGAMCNLRCTYCYYLPTLELYGGHEKRMDRATLDHVFAGFLPRAASNVNIAWQGGEPTLAGLDFFRDALASQQRHARPGQRVTNAIQTNGTRLDDDWCRFMREHGILVGLSLDGPERFHDHYRLTVRGERSAPQVLDALDRLQQHGVEYNILCVLNDRNVHHPDELLGYFLNRGQHWLQFIPAIEWETDPDTGAPRLAPYSPSGEAYGRFLCQLFDRWFARHRHQVSIRLFDSVLMKLVQGEMPFCMLSGSCHAQLTVEHDGSVFGCDHYVEPRWRLGRITDARWPEALEHERLATFAARKQYLPAQCESCQWRSLCHGGCPKHRPHRGDAPEPTTLCAGYRMFYEHAMDRLQWLAGFLRRGQQPPPPGADAPPVSSAASPGASPAVTPRANATRHAPSAAPRRMRRAPGRNAPCPCGSGRKYKQCHGKPAP